MPFADPNARREYDRRRYAENQGGRADKIRRRTKRQDEARKARRLDLQDELDKLKVARGCEDCGYNAHPRALDFDHRGGEQKRACVSDLLFKASREVVLLEVSKCAVRCANCHRIRHAAGTRKGGNLSPAAVGA